MVNIFATAYQLLHFSIVLRMVAIFQKVSKPNSTLDFICGGTLVSANKVVTAAHCIHPKHRKTPTTPEELSLLFGAFDLKNSLEPDQLFLPVSSYSLHQDWNYNTDRYNDDVAVLLLEKNIPISRFVQPICLSDRIDAKEGMVTGWGETKSSNEKLPIQMKQRIIQADLECYKRNPKLEVIDHKNSFCAVANTAEKEVCIGDSGSVLIVVINEVFYFKGIVSSIDENHNTRYTANTPAFYTDVPKYISFINSSDQIKVTNVELPSTTEQPSTTEPPSTTEQPSTTEPLSTTKPNHQERGLIKF
jgi:secreted trypsin-like serine protease